MAELEVLGAAELEVFEIVELEVFEVADIEEMGLTLVLPLPWLELCKTLFSNCSETRDSSNVFD